MKRLSRFTITALCALLIFVATGWTECSKEQKQAVIDLSLNHFVSLVGQVPGLLGDAGAAADAYLKNRTEGNYKAAEAAFNAVLTRHDLSSKEREIASLALDIFKAFAPATFAEMDPNSADALAARKELEAKFKKLEKLVGK